MITLMRMVPLMIELIMTAVVVVVVVIVVVIVIVDHYYFFFMTTVKVHLVHFSFRSSSKSTTSGNSSFNSCNCYQRRNCRRSSSGGRNELIRVNIVQTFIVKGGVGMAPLTTSSITTFHINPTRVSHH